MKTRQIYPTFLVGFKSDVSSTTWVRFRCQRKIYALRIGVGVEGYKKSVQIKNCCLVLLHVTNKEHYIYVWMVLDRQ